ncbi:MAG TPA: serine hydrolase [Candidatus Dormibacteraeota bacterium]|nr:serine hydrolase [Candidatus Dormibacteraeota bacterium]
MKRFAWTLLAILAVAWPESGGAQTGLGPEKKVDGWAVPAAPESTGMTSKPLRDMESAIRSGAFKKIGSVLIARHGKLIYEGYFEGDASTLRDTRSATKSITSTLVGIAIAEQKLAGVDARVLEILPERARKMQNPDPRKDRITVEDFLTMSSPLECDDWNDASRGNEERMYVIEDWAQFILDLPVRGRMHVGERVELPKYGRSFSYCTGGVFVLSEVLQKATGLRTDRYAQEKLFGPLGITDALWVYSPMNIPQTGGGLRLSSLDLLKVAELYRNGGQWQGSRIVSQTWVEISTRPHVQIDDQMEYGYLWWLKTFKSGGKDYPAYFMNGNGGNKIAVFPESDLSVVITSTNYNTRGMHEQTEKLLTDYILAAVEK